MTWLAKIAVWLLGRIFGGDATVKADAARTDERAKNVEAENAVLKAAAVDRARGDAERMRLDPRAGDVHSNPDDAINRDPNLHLRD